MIGADDTNKYFAAFKWILPASGTYRLGHLVQASTPANWWSRAIDEH
jgi:hypothetical protein